MIQLSSVLVETVDLNTINCGPPINMIFKVDGSLFFLYYMNVLYHEVAVVFKILHDWLVTGDTYYTTFQ